MLGAVHAAGIYPVFRDTADVPIPMVAVRDVGAHHRVEQARVVGDEGPFERIELQGGVAFRTKLPPGAENMNIYGEGGGLVWRIIVTPNPRDVEATEMKRTFTSGQTVRGGSPAEPDGLS